jgi:hypothetical protein
VVAVEVASVVEVEVEVDFQEQLATYLQWASHSPTFKAYLENLQLFTPLWISSQYYPR